MDPAHSIGHLTTEELYRQYAGFVGRFLTRLSVSAEYLDDAIQEVFLVVHRNGGYRPGLAKPTSYLANIAIHAAANHRQRLATARKRQAQAPVDLVASDAQDPGHELEVRRDLERLRRALEELPEDLRTTLLLVEMEEESCVSVAAGLNCPVGTVYSRLHAARKRLQAALRASAPRTRKAAANTNEHALPSRSWALVLGLADFRSSEAGRLLQLARKQQHECEWPALELPPPAVQPIWATSYSPPAASWLGVAGVPGTMLLTAAALILSAAPFARSSLYQEQAVGAGAPVASTLAVAIEDTAPSRSPAKAPDAFIKPNEPLYTATAGQRPRSSTTRRQPRARQRAAWLSAREPHKSGALLNLGDSPNAPPADSEPEANQTDETRAAQPEPRTAQPEQATKPEELARDITQAIQPTQVTRPSEPVAPRRGAAPTNDADLAEIRSITQAEHALPRDPKRTLDLTRTMRKQFSSGHLQEERDYLELMALHKLGRTRELRAQASDFLRDHPSGLYSMRVRSIVVGTEK